MIAALANLIFSAISLLSNSISYVIFHTVACSFVILVQIFKIPGEAINALMKLVRETAESCVPKLCKLVVDLINEVVTVGFDLSKGRAVTVMEWISVMIGGVKDIGMTWFGQFLEEWPKVFEGFIEMLSSVVSGLWNNCKDALYYVYQKLVE